MNDLAELFPDFSAHWIDTGHGKMFARAGGDGPPVVLIHGYPQTGAMWHRVAPALAEHHRVVVVDLRGYGWSVAPPGDGGRAAYTKRTMAQDVVRVMEDLGHVHFTVIGHDRGARVGYRMALDEPGRVKALALLDIIPTITMWDEIDAARALKTYHWAFLAQPRPLPETLIGGAPIMYLDHTLASWTAAKNLDDFDPGALGHYRASFNNPSRIHAACEDYRAGATTDVEHDRADLNDGKVIACPTLILWGESGIPAAGSSPLDVWRRTFAPNAEGQALPGGHFLAEENPEGTIAALRPWLSASA